MIALGADIIDIGARSTARSPPISVATGLNGFLLHSLSKWMGPVSRSLWTPCIVQCSSVLSPMTSMPPMISRDSPIQPYARIVADAGLPALLMASENMPGDATKFQRDAYQTYRESSIVVQMPGHPRILDPGIGLWTPQRNCTLDWGNLPAL